MTSLSQFRQITVKWLYFNAPVLGTLEDIFCFIVYSDASDLFSLPSVFSCHGQKGVVFKGFFLVSRQWQDIDKRRNGPSSGDRYLILSWVWARALGPIQPHPCLPLRAPSSWPCGTQRQACWLLLLVLAGPQLSDSAAWSSIRKSPHSSTCPRYWGLSLGCVRVSLESWLRGQLFVLLTFGTILQCHSSSESRNNRVQCTGRVISDRGPG